MKFYPGIRDDKTRLAGYVFRFKIRGDMVVANVTASFADKIYMIGQIAVVAVLHSVELQLFY